MADYTGAGPTFSRSSTRFVADISSGRAEITLGFPLINDPLGRLALWLFRARTHTKVRGTMCRVAV